MNKKIKEVLMANKMYKKVKINRIDDFYTITIGVDCADIDNVNKQNVIDIINKSTDFFTKNNITFFVKVIDLFFMLPIKERIITK